MVIIPKFDLQCIVQAQNSLNFMFGVLIQKNECVLMFYMMKYFWIKLLAMPENFTINNCL